MKYTFAEFEFNEQLLELKRNGDVVEAQPKMFELLAYLLAHRDRLIPKDKLIDEVWSGRIISDATISSRVSALRHALDDSGTTQRFIKTIYGKGFRFIGDVQEHSGVTVYDRQGNPNQKQGQKRQSRRSIAVLPFRTIGPARAHAMLSQALPSEIIMAMARLRWMFVIARGSSFRFDSLNVRLDRLREQLGVDYCLMGSIETLDEALTVGVELVDARNGEIIWTDRYTTTIGGIHEIRQEIVSQVVSGVEVELPAYEAARARLKDSASLDAWESYHIGLSKIFSLGRRDLDSALGDFERAISLDPNFARAHAGLAHVHWWRSLQLPSQSRSITLERMFGEIDTALSLDANDPFVSTVAGRGFWVTSDEPTARSHFERAIGLSPSYCQAFSGLAGMQALSGAAEQALENNAVALSLSPLDPTHHNMCGTQISAYLTLGKIPQAAEWANKASARDHDSLPVMCAAITALHLDGQTDVARRVATRISSQFPGIAANDLAARLPNLNGPLVAMLAGVLANYDL